MARMKNEKRADGRVQSKIYLGTVDGKKKYKYVYATNNRELEQKVQELKIKLGKGLDVTAERDKFSYWAEKWIKLKSSEVSHGRTITYSARIANLGPIKDMEICNIRTADIQEIVFDLSTENPKTKKPMAKKTLQEVKGTAVQIFNLAIENRVLDYNPAIAVKIPKNAPVKSKEALTKEQQQWIIETEHRAQTAAMIMLFAGLRRGELIPLLWSDIDLNEGTISINKASEFINGQAHVKNSGKTKAAIRTVYIPQILIDYLKPRKGLEFEFVCSSAKGCIMSDSGWKRMWSSYLAELNFKYGDFENSIEWNKKHTQRPTSRFIPEKIPMLIPDITPHCLRHTYITNMYFAGVDILTAKEQAGHADIETTLSIYTHLDATYKKKSIRKLDNYYKRNTKKDLHA